MKNTFSLIAIVAVVAFSPTACKKYEDGPALSLRTKKARITNTWRYVSVTGTNGVDYSAQFANVTLDMQKDGIYTITEGSIVETGTWNFSSDKEAVTFIPNAGSSVAAKILRLTNKELWLYGFLPNGGFSEYHLGK